MCIFRVWLQPVHLSSEKMWFLLIVYALPLFALGLQQDGVRILPCCVHVYSLFQLDDDVMVMSNGKTVTNTNKLIGYILAEYIHGDDAEPTRSDCVDRYACHALQKFQTFLLKTSSVEQDPPLRRRSPPRQIRLPPPASKHARKRSKWRKYIFPVSTLAPLYERCAACTTPLPARRRPRICGGRLTPEFIASCSGNAKYPGMCALAWQYEKVHLLTYSPLALILLLTILVWLGLCTSTTSLRGRIEVRPINGSNDPTGCLPVR